MKGLVLLLLQQVQSTFLTIEYKIWKGGQKRKDAQELEFLVIFLDFLPWGKDGMGVSDLGPTEARQLCCPSRYILNAVEKVFIHNVKDIKAKLPVSRHSRCCRRVMNLRCDEILSSSLKNGIKKGGSASEKRRETSSSSIKVVKRWLWRAPVPVTVKNLRSRGAVHQF